MRLKCELTLAVWSLKQAVVEAAKCAERLMVHAPSNPKELQLNEDDARWVCSWAMSRETGGKYGGYIYPLLDLANHASWTAGRTGTSGMQNGHAFSTTVPPQSHREELLVAKHGRGFVARRNMSVGEQVFDQCALHRLALPITRPILITVHGYCRSCLADGIATANVLLIIQYGMTFRQHSCSLYPLSKLDSTRS